MLHQCLLQKWIFIQILPLSRLHPKPLKMIPLVLLLFAKMGDMFELFEFRISWKMQAVARPTTVRTVTTNPLQPKATEVIEHGGHALNPRGERYTAETIRARLNMRDFMETLRASGIPTGGPAALSQTERRQFANQLDAFLAQHLAGAPR